MEDTFSRGGVDLCIAEHEEEKFPLSLPSIVLGFLDTSLASYDKNDTSIPGYTWLSAVRGSHKSSVDGGVFVVVARLIAPPVYQ